MRGLGVERIPIRLDRSGINPWADLNLLRAYWRLLERLRPVAYLGYTIKPNIYGSLAAASLGIPAIPNVSGFRRSRVVFFHIGDDCHLFVERRMVRPEPARVLPGSGVDLERFAPAPLAEGAPTFLFVGRLLRDKGVLEFVEAARSLHSELPRARFQLLGPIDEGNRTAITRQEIDSWVAQGVIDYLGTSDDVRPFIAAATAIVLPSYREGLPRSLLEAAAMARPLVAADAPGCRDVVEDGVNGYLCAVRDPGSLADAMRRVAELPPAERLAMGQAARRKVQAQFSEDFVIRAYLDILAGVETGQSGS